MYHQQRREYQLILINTMLNFEDSKLRCKDVGGEMAAPLSEKEIGDWLQVQFI